MAGITADQVAAAGVVGAGGPEVEAALPAERTKVLFVARLVEDKGCMAFIRGFLGALAQAPGELHAIIVGDGPYRKPMRAAVAECGALDHVSFLGQIAHDQIVPVQQRCDVYVSLNPMGNLTNANLEALKAGACMIVPASPPENGIDPDIDVLGPSETVWRVTTADDVDGLIDALLRLHRDPAERQRRGAAAAAIGQRLLPSWDERIDREIALLVELAAAGRSAPRASFGNA